MTEKQRYDSIYQSLQDNNKLIHVGQLLPRSANKWPNKIVVICQDEKISYRELFYNAILLANQLKQAGVTPKDRVLILYENTIEFYIAYFAVWHVGAIVAPLNVFLTSSEIFKILEDARPSAIIISPEQFKKLENYENKLAPIFNKINKTSVIDNSIINNIEIVQRNLHETAAILYTSGTTGFPKGVMLTSHNIIVNTIQGIARLQTVEEERVYCALPLFHSLPQNICMWSNVIVGCTAIIAPKIDRHSINQALHHKPTVIVAVPALYGIFCKMQNLNFGKVKYFFCGGDALSDKIRAYFSLIYRRKLSNGYGLTETSPFISVDMDDYTQPANTVGVPFTNIECQIRDENGQNLFDGKIGVLWVKGPNVMKGYYNAPEATDAILKDGWLNTGDFAYFDENNKIVITGREKDVIKNKGIIIYPQEIENLLLTNNKVFQAGVIGIKDTDGEIPVAFIASLEKDQEKLKEELTRLCKQNLAPYKIPRKFVILKTLPVTSTGKVDKKKLRSDYKI